MDHQGTLRIDARYDQGMAEMVFADDGCGMEPDVLENIFEPFFTRAATARDRPGAVDHPPDRQPAPRRDHGRQPRDRARARPSPSGSRSTRPRSTATGRARPQGRPSRRLHRAGRAATMIHDRIAVRGPARHRRPSEPAERHGGPTMEKPPGRTADPVRRRRAHLRDLMQMELPRLGHEVTVCPDGAAASRALEGHVRRGPARPADAGPDAGSRSWARSARSAPRPRSSS